MYWEKIEGFFNFDNIYDRMVREAENGAVFAEIGSWKGRSTMYMAEAIKKSGKKIKFYAIDTFKGTENEKETLVDNLYEEYLKNIEPLKEYITTIRGDSSLVHPQIKNNELDFLFIDGDHRYKGVRNDLINWYPKVKSKGIISGHDYAEPTCGVKIAVDQYFLFTGIQTDRTSWIYKKP